MQLGFQYNILGQRISRIELINGVTNTEYYVHDGTGSASPASAAIVADLDEDKELLRSYSYALGYDNIISMTSYGDTETNTYFYIRNHNNSVVALVDEDGSVAESYTYTAYGEVTVFDSNGNELDESTLGNRYCFQGREIDWSTGLYNFRARWYDAETGRWLSKDPIGINGGLNQYVFCGNNPVMFLDPSGLRIRENVVDTRIVNGVPQVLVQTLEWNIWGGINKSKPVGDPVWRSATTQKEFGYFDFDGSCYKQSGYRYPLGALGQETKGMEHAANQMYVSGVAGAAAVGTSPYWVPPTLSFGAAMFYTGGAFYLSNAAEINTGLLYGIPSAQTSYIAGVSAGAEFLIEKILDDIL